MPVSAIFIASYALLIIALAMYVSRLRLRTRVSIGDGDDYDLGRARRAHANAVENAVIMMPLAFVYEFLGGSALALAILCGVFMLCRLLHAWGLLQKPTTIRRSIGAVGTYAIEVTLAVFVLIKALRPLLS